MRLKDKVALITGSTKGIGAAIALEMAKEGAKVIITGRDPNGAEEVISELKALKANFLIVFGDLANMSFTQSLGQKGREKWGAVDILVNNAGFETRKSSLEFSENDFEQMMNVNLRAAFFLSQYVLPSMKEKGWGRIINISSIHEDKPTGFSSIYSMTKGGMRMMTREMAQEFSAFGITVNNLAPGAIRTDMNKVVLSDKGYEQRVIQKIPSKFIGEPIDIAKAAIYLASADARYVTGSTLFVDGGLSL